MQTGFGRNPTYNFFYQYYFTIYREKSQTFDGKYLPIRPNYFIKNGRADIGIIARLYRLCCSIFLFHFLSFDELNSSSASQENVSYEKQIFP